MIPKVGYSTKEKLFIQKFTKRT